MLNYLIPLSSSLWDYLFSPALNSVLHHLNFLSMAEVLISPVLEQLASYVQQEVKLAVHVREEVKKLTTTLKIIQGVVEDAERKQVKEKAVKDWLEELKDAIYVADDVLDEWNTKMLISQLSRAQVDVEVAATIRKKVLSYLLSLCSCFKQVTVRYDIGQRIKEIRERLDMIAERRIQYGLTVSQNSDEPRPLTNSFIDVPVIRGRDNDKNVIMEKLLGEGSRQEVVPVHVISIVGMGGFGKTTLAKLVYKEEKVVATFEKMIWVCVSQPFDQTNQTRVAKEIIEQATGNVPRSVGLEALRQELSNSVKGKCIFLVLDDVWTTDPHHCRQLKLLLDGGAPGSRILVTTRSEEVARMLESSYTYNLGKLSEEESWHVLCDIALKGREEEVKFFEKIGIEIAAKCKGVPLAIQTLASLLYQKTEKREWRDILVSELWDLPEIDHFFLPSLLLSYYNLPSISKLCFSYCAIFPKDSKMEKDDLVKLWMAQGFLGSDETKDLEKLGGYYFDNLAMSSFFQDFEKNSNGSIASCKMHDLVHDLAEFLSHNECFNMPVPDRGFDCNKTRHLGALDFESPSILDTKNLRTLLRPNVYRWSCRVPDQLFDKLSCLRTLDLSLSDLEKLPDKVGNLLHLRYIDLSYTSLSELPETVCNLYNLQTLKLNFCQRLVRIPEGIGKLFKLRHLEVEETYELSCLPQGIKRLSSLQTLCKFIVVSQNKIGDLGPLNKLQGSLEIMGLEKVTDAAEAAQAELKRKRNIRKLTFSFALLEGDDDAPMVMERVLEELEPPEYLESVGIKKYQGHQFPGWMQEGPLIDNIVEITLDGCVNCSQLPALGKWASLKHLSIGGMRSVVHIGNEFYGFNAGNNFGDGMGAFPKLETLVFRDMCEWGEWELPLSKNTKMMPFLKVLRLENCAKLRVLPCLGKLESLEDLHLYRLSSVREVGSEFLGISHDVVDGDGVVLFSKLKKLELRSMDELEQWNIPPMSVEVRIMPNLQYLRLESCPKLREFPDVALFESLETLQLWDLPEWKEREEEEGDIIRDKKQDRGGGRSLRSLSIWNCPKLNVVPHSMFSPMLRQLMIDSCPQLRGKQPCLPPLLEDLFLVGDVGVFSESLPLKDEESRSSIRSFGISSSPHSSLPKGFNQLKSLQMLWFSNCQSLDFELKELQQFTMLQDLQIYNCPTLKQRFQGEEWRRILPHVPKITIDDEKIN